MAATQLTALDGRRPSPVTCRIVVELLVHLGPIHGYFKKRPLQRVIHALFFFPPAAYIDLADRKAGYGDKWPS